MLASPGNAAPVRDHECVHGLYFSSICHAPSPPASLEPSSLVFGASKIAVIKIDDRLVLKNDRYVSSRDLRWPCPVTRRALSARVYVAGANGAVVRGALTVENIKGVTVGVDGPLQGGGGRYSPASAAFND